MFMENDPAENDVETLRQTKEVFRHLAENIQEVLFVIERNPPRMAYGWSSPQCRSSPFGFRSLSYSRIRSWPGWWPQQFPLPLPSRLPAQYQDEPGARRVRSNGKNFC